MDHEFAEKYLEFCMKEEIKQGIDRDRCIENIPAGSDKPLKKHSVYLI